MNDLVHLILALTVLLVSMPLAHNLKRLWLERNLSEWREACLEDERCRQGAGRGRE
jgi:hypothetical protein